ncbi:HAD family hydrolase [Synechococcus sp. L2F]|uniref:HAD family hydrolase n=1 Tax=Synechococcus sp. L2F TaxID=2823739 RepID=UPI0020CD2280|nr:HAD family hydrolase [Synechococcus sp. L2F]MCP9827925.1 HAD family hydrolase [Synechococcus sp. L2F]
MNLLQYSSIIFDCDGVVLDSNRIKTEAFRIAAQPYGSAAADALVAHHVANGGVSRYKKFATFLELILPEHAPNAVAGQDGPDVEQLLMTYAKAVRTGLMTCAVADGLEALRASTPHARWLIVSGGDQKELRQIFAERGIAQLFDGGIFGSPDTKDQILAREIESDTITKPALFLGDSRYDYTAATAAGLDFAFVHGWTELPEWNTFVTDESIPSVAALLDLLT